MTFNPAEWTKKLEVVNGVTEYIYINEHTGLSKLRVTFTRDQQHELDSYQFLKSVKR